MPPPKRPEPLAILLIGGTHERAHYAFMLAAAAAAIDRPVTLFATNAGCHALCTDWSGLQHAADDATTLTRGIAGLDELRTVCLDLGVHLQVACDTGLRLAALSPDLLLPAVELTGLPTFLAATKTSQMITL